jgi:hypothetical protein
MAKWLEYTQNFKGIFFDLSQFEGMAPTGELFCRSCQSRQAAFKPATLHKNRPDKTILVPPTDLIVRSFCARCGLMYEKQPIPPKVRAQVELKDKATCVYCGLTKRKDYDFSCDHIIPEIDGGQATVENLVFCCQSCNSSKGKKKQWFKPRYGRFEGQKGDWRQELNSARTEKALMQCPPFLRKTMSDNEQDHWACVVACLDMGIEPPTDEELNAIWPL